MIEGPGTVRRERDLGDLQQGPPASSGSSSSDSYAGVFIDFLTRLVRQSAGQKIILILDGHPVHRAKKVRALGRGTRRTQIELQFLPGYSPELNPTELLNQDVKTNAARPPPPPHPGRTDRRHPQLPPLNPTPTTTRRPLLRRRTRQLRQSRLTAIYRPE